MTKREMYKTAVVALGCAGFPEGTVVAVRYLRQCECHGTHYYTATLGDRSVDFPESQLRDFVL